MYINLLKRFLNRSLSFVLFLTILSAFNNIKAQTTVFFNEIHYDNTGGDVGEAIEIAGPAGTDLTGWSIVLYNGNGGATYATSSLSGTIPDLGGGYGVVYVSIAGIQNGSPDGMALVNAANAVIQFLSYEGTFTAVGGPAAGMLSTDIGVFENGSGAVGNSLQLSGTGSTYEDFTWNIEGPGTFGNFNTNQSFGAVAGNTAPSVVETTPFDGAAGITLDTDIVITFSEDVSVSSNWFSISGSSSGSHSAIVSGGPGTFTINPDLNFDEGETVTVTITGSNVIDLDPSDPLTMTSDFLFTFSTLSLEPLANAFINEIHYDNVSTDVGEAIEVAGTAGINLAGWSLVLYNGSNGTSYFTINLSGIIPDICDGYGTLFFDGPGNGIQNGSPDGMALIDNSNRVVQFLSYEGTMTATNGPASGLTSIDIGVSETASTPVGASLQLTGRGLVYSDFKWKYQDVNTFGTCNIKQTFGEPLPPIAAEIFEIQGSGLFSPLEDRIVITTNNVVTAVGPDGFFMQTPAERDDYNDNTSNGIYVFTSSLPSVNLGDLVDVTGEAVEYFDFTEIIDPIVFVVGTASVPAPFEFNESVPSPLQPQSTVEFERFEGMLVSIIEGTVTASNQYFGSDPQAEIFIAAKSQRTFREPGIEYPNLTGTGAITWDGNPEVFELDPDRLGLPNQVIAAGSTFNAEGVIGFEYGGYELWPTSLSVLNTPVLPRAVRLPGSDEATIGSFNMLRLFDSNADSKKGKLSGYIRNVLNSPDILAVQEVETITALTSVADQISLDDPTINYTAYLEEGNDIGGIDVGFLVRHDRVQVNSIMQIGKDETYIDPSDGSIDILHDRPPLLLDADIIINGVPALPVKVLAVHIRSLNGIETERVQTKRLTQAQSIATIVQDLQNANPAENIIVTGDFNAFEFTDGFVDVVGHIKGDFNPSESVLSGDDLVNPNLTDQVLSVPASNRYSYVFEGNAQVLDHSLTSQSLGPRVTGFDFGRGNSDAADVYENDINTNLKASDHDGLVLYISTDIVPPQFVLNEEANLWPANHKCKTFTIDDMVSSITENGSPFPFESVYIVKVTSDEEVNNGGDGNTNNDIVIVDCQTVKLRAERSGNGNGRVYTVFLAAQDAVGNSATVEYKVSVPHNKKSTAIDDGPIYEIFSDCTPPEITGAVLAKTNNSDEEVEEIIPEEYSLSQNYPNPFNPTTSIRFDLKEQTHVSLKVYDMLGREITTLVNGNKAAGRYEYKFNAGNLTSGIYIYKLTTDSFVDIKKMLLLK